MVLNNELFEKRYREMTASGLTEDFLDKNAFGELKMFINAEPKKVMFLMKIGPDDIYIGTDTEEAKQK